MKWTTDKCDNIAIKKREINNWQETTLIKKHEIDNWEMWRNRD